MKSVLITGCSSGFGRELVPRYLDRGWKVFASMRSIKTRASLFSAELQKYPTELELIELDLTSKTDRDAVIKRFEQEKLDCLVNNAGYGLFGAVEDLGESQVREQIEVNFFGLFLLTQGLLPSLRRTHGRIFNLSSAVGYIGLPFSSLYVTSKFAVEGFSESLYFELKPFGVQVCLIEPSQHRTGFGEKLTYGERSFDSSSVYFPFSQKFKAYRERRKASAGIPSQNVVKKIMQLSEQAKIPLRVRVGTGAHLAYYAKRLLPESWYLALLSSVFSRVLFRS